jgi:hypothetical protein
MLFEAFKTWPAFGMMCAQLCMLSQHIDVSGKISWQKDSQRHMIRKWKFTSPVGTNILLTLVVVLFCELSLPPGSMAGPYVNSAHGSNVYGVNRTRTAGFGYAQGNCAHCHEQHASIGGVELGGGAPYPFCLFYDDWIGVGDLFCFECHSESSEHQQVPNDPYCVNFGGRSRLTGYTSIKRQFTNDDSNPDQCGSRHNLREVRESIIDNNHGWGFSSDPDPCAACHNPHASQQNYPVVIQADKLNTAIRRPVHYGSQDPDKILWGDDLSERMSAYAASTGGTYQAPYYGSPGDPVSGPFEPADDSISDGSNLPDYATYCLDCHQYQQYNRDTAENVKAIEWAQERHGACASNTCNQDENPEQPYWEGSLKPPYNDLPNSHYVLSCLDCHEPHGTKKRLHLIRRMINGENVPEDSATSGHCDHEDRIVEICQTCHNWLHTTIECAECHYHGAKFKGFGDCYQEPLF